MIRFLGSIVFAIIGIASVNVVLLKYSPGDPAIAILGEHATPEAIHLIRTELGLDDPMFAQWVRSLKRTLTFDFGASYRSKIPVSQEIARTFPVTFLLGGLAIFLASFLGVGMGWWISGRRNRWVPTVRGLLFGLQNVPIFLIGLSLVLVVAGMWNLLPVSGIADPSGWILPVLTLSVYPTILIARMTIQNLEENLGKDYVRTALAKGVSMPKAKFVHALPNALLPILTTIGSYAGVLCSGAVMTETVFAIPGVGRLMLQAVENRDLPLIQGTLTCVVLLIFGSSLLADLGAKFLDPRSRR